MRGAVIGGEHVVEPDGGGRSSGIRLRRVTRKLEAPTVRSVASMVEKTAICTSSGESSAVVHHLHLVGLHGLAVAGDARSRPGPAAARLPSSPAIGGVAVLVDGAHPFAGGEILNEVLRFGSRAMTSARAKGRAVAPMSRKRWPKA